MMTGRRNHHPAWRLVLLSLLVLSCAVDEPVGPDYYNDIAKIKGGQKPTTPEILPPILFTAPDEITITFSSDGSDGPGGPDGAYDPDSNSNEGLYYLFYGSETDPSTFPDEREYYSELYYIGYTLEADFSGDPKDVSVFVNQAFHGLLYFWITSYDGGRESDHSNVASVLVP
jgi:hypothetical protein